MDIDVVYTWVNHMDPEWQQLHHRETARRIFGRSEHRSVNDMARFANRGELYYSVRTVQRFAPWVRKIFVITNCRAPDWAATIDNLQFVAHEDVFPDVADLPTFNAFAIETTLHRIPGLAEHFLYLNDDFFFCKPLDPDKFFPARGRVHIFPSKHDIPYGAPLEKRRPVDDGAINSARLIYEEFGWKPTKKLHHTAYPLCKSILERLERRFAAQVAQTRNHQFRHKDDIALATTLHAYYAKGLGRGAEVAIASRYVDIGDPLFIFLVHRWSTLMRGKYATLCLNEVTSIPFGEAWRDRVVKRTMRKLIDE